MSESSNDNPNHPSDDELRAKLESDLLQGGWTDLQPHAERQAVFVVDPSLILVDVAFNVARDNVKAISLWLEQGLLARPTPNQLADWNADPGREFRFLIVAPYVLIQNLAH